MSTAKRGRPSKPLNKKRTEVIAVLVTPAEKRKVLRLAKKVDQRVSSFARDVLIENLPS